MSHSVFVPTGNADMVTITSGASIQVHTGPMRAASSSCRLLNTSAGSRDRVEVGTAVIDVSVVNVSVVNVSVVNVSVVDVSVLSVSGLSLEVYTVENVFHGSFSDE